MIRTYKKKGRSVSGWVILDKQVGIRSTEAVSQIKWLFNAQKAGHAGTLDPLASGLLPIALGEATKTVSYVMDGTKTYHFCVAWGEERSTDDREGEITKTSPHSPRREDILALLPKYTGTILQVPPQFSAVKISGKRAYNLARRGETVEILPRRVKIDSLKLIETPHQGHSLFEITCGKGTYVRSLARDMGRDLGCYGYVCNLRRISVAPFCENNLITWSELKAAAPNRNRNGGPNELSQDNFSELDALLIETEAALNCLSHYTLSETQAQRVKTGDSVLLYDSDVSIDPHEIYVTYQNKLLATGIMDKGKFTPKKIFTIV